MRVKHLGVEYKVEEEKEVTAEHRPKRTKAYICFDAQGRKRVLFNDEVEIGHSNPQDARPEGRASSEGKVGDRKDSKKPSTGRSSAKSRS